MVNCIHRLHGFLATVIHNDMHCQFEDMNLIHSLFISHFLESKSNALRFLSSDTLKEFFSNFGEVTECHIMKDQVTKRSRSG